MKETYYSLKDFELSYEKTLLREQMTFNSTSIS